LKTVIAGVAGRGVCQNRPEQKYLPNM